MSSSDGLSSTRRGVYLSPDQLDDGDLVAAYRRAVRRDAGYGWMFAEDVRNGILPWSHNSRFVAAYEGTGAERLTELTVAGAGRGGAHGGVTEAARAFIQSGASSLLTTTDTVYEVELLTRVDASRSDEIAALRIHPLLPGTFDIRRSEPIQRVPAWVTEERFIELDPDLVFRLTLPPKLDDTVTRTLDLLGHVDAFDTREFLAIQQKLRGEIDIPFDAYSVARRRLVAVGTAATGWDARGTFREDQLDPWAVSRRLTFLGFCIELRDAIIEQGNALLGRLAGRLGAEARLVPRRVPSLRDVADARTVLSLGSRPLGDLLSFALQQTEFLASASERA
jgi:hypothetical protein